MGNVLVPKIPVFVVLSMLQSVDGTALLIQIHVQLVAGKSYELYLWINVKTGYCVINRQWWSQKYQHCLFCLFGFFRPTREFSLIWRRHYYGEGLQILIYARLSLPLQWGFFGKPHLLWHGASVYYGHLRGPVTLTPIAEPYSSWTVTACVYVSRKNR